MTNSLGKCGRSGRDREVRPQRKNRARLRADVLRLVGEVSVDYSVRCRWGRGSSNSLAMWSRKVRNTAPYLCWANRARFRPQAADAKGGSASRMAEAAPLDRRMLLANRRAVEEVSLISSATSIYPLLQALQNCLALLISPTFYRRHLPKTGST